MNVIMPIPQEEIPTTILSLKNRMKGLYDEIDKLRETVKSVQKCCDHSNRQEILYLSENDPYLLRAKWRCLICEASVYEDVAPTEPHPAGSARRAREASTPKGEE